MNVNIYDFLKDNGMIFEGDVHELTEAVYKELSKARTEGSDSFAMLRSYIRKASVFPAGQALAVDIGGTNLRLSVFDIEKDGSAVQSRVMAMKVPGLEGPVTASEFLDYIAEKISLYPQKKLGLCYSFLARIMPDRDAEIFDISKELKVTGTSGLILGREINERLIKKGLPPKDITVINDSCAAYLGSALTGRFPDASVILGTGYNNCYCDPFEDGMLINTESGRYRSFKSGTFDKLASSKTDIPSDFLAEKQVSGAYLGMIIHETAAGAAKAGLFTDETAGELLRLKSLSTPDSCRLLLNDPAVFKTETDLSNYKDIFSLLTDRASIYVSALTCACVIASRPQDGREALIAAEGSTFYKVPGLKEKIEQYSGGILKKSLGINAKYIKAEGSVARGTALAALM